MPTPKYDPETYHPQQSYSAKQLSRYDMQVAGVVVYVVAMAVVFVVALVLMLFWNETATQAHAQTVVSAASERQGTLAELTQPLPTEMRAQDVYDACSVECASSMTGDSQLAIAVPFTSGFAPAGNEPAEAQAQR